tara:strand:- start:61 stop:426 length:366 start_codon:yes stop_codon:yes gene_type:complete
MKQILLISLLLTTAGCSLIPSQTKAVEVVSIAAMPKIYHPPLPLELQLVDIDWTIFTPDLMEEYLDNVKKGDAPAMAFYSLSTQDYQNLSMNTADQKRYLKEILSIVEYYRSLNKKGDENE